MQFFLFLPLLLSVFLRAQCASDPSDLKAIKQSFITEGVVKDLLNDFNPIASMKVVYLPENTASTIVNPGLKVSRDLTLQQPEFFITAPPDAPIPNGSNFTLIMVDPDVPSRVQPTMSGFRHMLATDVHLKPSPDPKSGSQLTFASRPVSPYLPPSPPQGSGFHRYVFLLYGGQPTASSVAPFAGNGSRIKFNLKSFIASAGLGEPLAGTFMQVQSSSSQ